MSTTLLSQFVRAVVFHTLLALFGFHILSLFKHFVLRLNFVPNEPKTVSDQTIYTIWLFIVVRNEHVKVFQFDIVISMLTIMPAWMSEREREWERGNCAIESMENGILNEVAHSITFSPTTRKTGMEIVFGNKFVIRDRLRVDLLEYHWIVKLGAGTSSFILLFGFAIGFRYESDTICLFAIRKNGTAIRIDWFTSMWLKSSPNNAHVHTVQV